MLRRRREQGGEEEGGVGGGMLLPGQPVPRRLLSPGFSCAVHMRAGVRACVRSRQFAQFSLSLSRLEARTSPSSTVVPVERKREREKQRESERPHNAPHAAGLKSRTFITSRCGRIVCERHRERQQVRRPSSSRAAARCTASRPPRRVGVSLSL